MCDTIITVMYYLLKKNTNQCFWSIRQRRITNTWFLQKSSLQLSCNLLYLFSENEWIILLFGILSII